MANGMMSDNIEHCMDGTRTFLTYLLIGICINALISFIRTINIINLNKTNILIIISGVTYKYFSKI